MVHKKIRIPRENADVVIRSLGNLKNAIEFEDLTKNTEAQKNFADMIRRCDDVLKKITDYIRVTLDFHLGFEQYSKYDVFKADLEKDLAARDKKFGSTYFDLIEAEIIDNDRRIKELVDSHSQIREDLVSLIEKKHVFKKAQFLMTPDFSEVDAGIDGIKQSSSNLNFMAGVVSAENELKMRRMIFRISRGRAITAFYSLDIDKDEYLYTTAVSQRGFSLANKSDDNESRFNKMSSFLQGKELDKMNTKKKIFTIIFAGGEQGILLGKILKVCEIFQVSRYPVPKSSEIKAEVSKIEREIQEKKQLIMSIEKNVEDTVLIGNHFGNKRHIKYSLYRLYFEQEKLIYSTLNKCILHENFLDGEVWIPKDSLLEVEACLRNVFRGVENQNNATLEDIYRQDEKPPTYIPKNEFTLAFQMVVDTYGIPRYQEINPGYFTIITFPFLFGVMFGDIGHGLILLLFAIYLCVNLHEAKKGLFKDLLFARYFLLLMGIFALFCGMMYNDFLGVPFYVKSCYPRMGDAGDSLDKDTECRYKFGLDPVWYISSNELLFINSLKMKLSVILGVAQMILGILIKGFNNIYKGDGIEFIFVFIPELVLMLILFGYMDFLIFIKWGIDYTLKEYAAPDIKSLLMNIVLDLGKLPPKPEHPQGGEGVDWYLIWDRDTMEKVHLSILIISIVCIILMFLPKVLVDYFKARRKYRAHNEPEDKNVPIKEDNMNEDLDINNSNSKINIQSEQEEPRFSDFLVNQIIETIEFVLGTVSNTASYLRLWALSLAHSQLSVVFFEKCIGSVGTLTGSWFVNGFLLSISFIFFGFVTIIVLLFMDMMECFLHTLRLHWVEFQNKFYKADGYNFVPFCFRQNLKLENDEFNQLEG